MFDSLFWGAQLKNVYNKPVQNKSCESESQAYISKLEAEIQKKNDEIQMLEGKFRSWFVREVEERRREKTD
jgi:hypothetical protein